MSSVNNKTSTDRKTLSINVHEANGMRVLLYDVESSRYYQSPVGWTSDPTMAHDLVGTVQAVTVAFQNRLNAAEIILAFDESHLKDMHLPLRLSNGSNGGNGFQSTSCVALP